MKKKEGEQGGGYKTCGPRRMGECNKTVQQPLGEWRKSVIAPVLQNKGDVPIYTNYGRMKLVLHTMKIWE